MAPRNERTKISARELGVDEDLPPSESLQADVLEYLELVAEMPSIDQRTYDLGCWVTALGAARPRRGVKSRELTKILNDSESRRSDRGHVQPPTDGADDLWHRRDGKSAKTSGTSP